MNKLLHGWIVLKPNLRVLDSKAEGLVGNGTKIPFCMSSIVSIPVWFLCCSFSVQLHYPVGVRKKDSFLSARFAVVLFDVIPPDRPAVVLEYKSAEPPH